jgi:hypothetical protein
VAKAAMDCACIDEIFDSPLREYGININNRAGKWTLIHEEYVFNLAEIMQPHGKGSQKRPIYLQLKNMGRLPYHRHL